MTRLKGQEHLKAAHARVGLIRRARRDWCIAASVGTIFVGAVFAVLYGCLEIGPGYGATAILACYALSMFFFLLRTFGPLPPDSSHVAMPIRKGICVALLGGLSYGVCISLGVSLAGWYLLGPLWNDLFVKGWLAFQGATIVICGVSMVPAGLLAGCLRSLWKWNRARSGDPSEPPS